MFDKNLESSKPVNILINGENFDPETTYKIKIVPRGEIEGISSNQIIFKTGKGSIFNKY